MIQNYGEVKKMNSYYAVPMTSDEIYHHGIIGQKWGVRRYQNPDGSLTPAGEARYLGNKKAERNVNSLQKTATAGYKAYEKALNKAESNIDRAKLVGDKAAEIRNEKLWIEAKTNMNVNEYVKKYSYEYVDSYMKTKKATVVGTLIGGPLVGVAAGGIAGRDYRNQLKEVESGARAAAEKEYKEKYRK